MSYWSLLAKLLTQILIWFILTRGTSIMPKSKLKETGSGHFRFHSRVFCLDRSEKSHRLFEYFLNKIYKSFKQLRQNKDCSTTCTGTFIGPLGVDFYRPSDVLCLFFSSRSDLGFKILTSTADNFSANVPHIAAHRLTTVLSRTLPERGQLRNKPCM